MAEERLSAASHDYVELLFHWHRYQTAAALLKDLKVLEVGIGTAYGAAYLSDIVDSLTGIDVDPWAVQNAADLYPAPNLTFLLGDLKSHHFEDASFDAVIMFEVLEHVSKHEQPALIEEISRVLKPGGLFLMSTPDHDRTKDFAEENPYHIGELTEPELLSLLASSFAYTELYSQEINAASIIWKPNDQSFAGYGVDVGESSSHPAPVSQNKRLTLITQSSAAPLTASLAGFCVESERRILTELWDHIGNTEWRLRTAAEETERQTAKIAETQETEKRLQAELDQAEHDILVMSEDLLAIHASYQERLERLEQLEPLAEETEWLRQANASLQQQLDVVHNSRSWRAIQRYWRLMDSRAAGPVLQGVRKIVLRTRKPPSS